MSNYILSADKRLEKIALIKSFLCYVGYPLLAGNFFFAFIENLNNYKSFILLVIAVISGLIYICSKFIDLLKKILEFDTFYTEHKAKNGKSAKTKEEKRRATFVQVIISIIIFGIIMVWIFKH